MRFIRPSAKWFVPVYVTLAAVAYGAAFEAGRFSYSPPKPKIVRVERPTISSGASFAQVVANFSGKSYAHGAISDLPGFTCDAWTNGKVWVVLRCSK